MGLGAANVVDLYRLLENLLDAILGVCKEGESFLMVSVCVFLLRLTQGIVDFRFL